MSDDVDLGTIGARKRTVTLWVTAAVITAAVIAAVAVYALTAQPHAADAPGAEGAEPSPTPTVTAIPAPPTGSTAIGELVEADAVTILDAALAAPIAAVGTSTDLDELVKNVAAGSYASELEAQWQEFVSQGWTVKGAPSVITVEVTTLDTDATPAIAEIAACVDASDVSILDAEGDPVGDPAVALPRALHLFTLTQGDDEVWRITAHGFPNDPTC